MNNRMKSRLSMKCRKMMKMKEILTGNMKEVRGERPSLNRLEMIHRV